MQHRSEASSEHSINVCNRPVNTTNYLSPLSPKQYEHFLALLQSVDGNQASWIAGFFAAYTLKANVEAIEDPSLLRKDNLTILYGSMTGKGEDLASIAAQRAKQLGLNVTVQSMADFSVRNLTAVENLLLVVSTHGNGAPPAPAKELHGHLFSNRAPQLNGLNYTVLALGDSSYANFCQVGIEFDQQLEKLGAKRLTAVHLGDVDVATTATAWFDHALSLFGTGTVAPGIPGFSMVKRKQAKTKGPVSLLNKLNFAAPVRTKSHPLPSKSNPFSAPVLEKFNLHGKGSDRQTIHLELKADIPGMSYQPGDSAGVIPLNHPDLIQAVLDVTGFKAIDKVTFKEQERILEDILRNSVELSKVTPDVIKKYKAFCPSVEFQQLAENREQLSEYTTDRDIVDLLADFPTPELTPTDFLSILRPLQPRYYSISSSPLEAPGELHLTVGVVAFEKAGRPRKGTCSTYLSDVKVEDEHIPLFIEPNPHFRLPEDPTVPIIMIGAGTGIAPFRAFVQHRSHAEHAGKSWLFFGNRNFETEFLYQTEWQKHLKNGTLSKMDVAFSRDGNEKKYVQHCLLEQGAEVFNWLEEGAHIYLCGDMNGLSNDVQQTLVRIVSEQSRRNIEEAENYLDELQNTKRFQMDVY